MSRTKLIKAPRDVKRRNSLIAYILMLGVWVINKNWNWNSSFMSYTLDLVGIIEILGEDLHDWNIKITHYNLFRKDEVGKCKRGVALNIKCVSVGIRCLSSSCKAFQALLHVLHLKTCKKRDGRDFQGGIFWNFSFWKVLNVCHSSKTLSPKNWPLVNERIVWANHCFFTANKNSGLKTTERHYWNLP